MSEDLARHLQVRVLLIRQRRHLSGLQFALVLLHYGFIKLDFRRSESGLGNEILYTG